MKIVKIGRGKDLGVIRRKRLVDGDRRRYEYKIRAKVLFEGEKDYSEVLLTYYYHGDSVIINKKKFELSEKAQKSLENKAHVFYHYFVEQCHDLSANKIEIDDTRAIIEVESYNGKYSGRIYEEVDDNINVFRLSSVDVLQFLKSMNNKVVIKYLEKENEKGEEIIFEDLKSSLEFDIRNLMNVSSQYNNDYIVKVGNSVDERFARLLEWSGQRILHKPYFAMQGYTHEKWVINPYQKVGCDSALRDSAAINADEFLNCLKG